VIGYNIDYGVFINTHANQIDWTYECFNFIWFTIWRLSTINIDDVLR